MLQHMHKIQLQQEIILQRHPITICTKNKNYITYKRSTTNSRKRPYSIWKSIANATSNCQVSVIVNNVKPYQNATAAGTGGAVDYSKWKFDITSEYTTIKPGDDRITAKYECEDNPASKSFSSVNVTGLKQ